MASGQSITGTASPLPELKARDGKPDWPAVEALVAQWKPDAFVVGLPLNMDGSESAMSARARKFARQLEGRFGVPCHLIDERLSSREARDIGRAHAEMRGKGFSSRKVIDSFAAQLLLESWFAENL